MLRLTSKCLVKNIPPQPNPIRVLLPPPMLHTRRIACLRLAAMTTAAAAPAAPRHVQAVAEVHMRCFAPRFASQTKGFSQSRTPHRRATRLSPQRRRFRRSNCVVQQPCVCNTSLNNLTVAIDNQFETAITSLSLDNPISYDTATP